MKINNFLGQVLPYVQQLDDFYPFCSKYNISINHLLQLCSKLSFYACSAGANGLKPNQISWLYLSRFHQRILFSPRRPHFMSFLTLPLKSTFVYSEGTVACSIISTLNRDDAGVILLAILRHSSRQQLKHAWLQVL